MGFTRWPLTFCSQQDGVVINCWSLRAWTLLGPHFKRALRLCLLAESSVADRPGYGPISSSTRAHLEGSTLAENETLCLLMFSHDIFINTQSIHPYTSVIFLLSRSHCEALMRNIRAVFRIVPSAAVLLSSLPTKVHVSLSALATKTNEYLSHADLQVLLFRSSRCSEKVQRASAAIAIWLAAALAGRQSWLWELNRCEAESQSQGRYINYHSGSITPFCGSVNLPKALKAETRVMNSTACEDRGGKNMHTLLSAAHNTTYTHIKTESEALLDFTIKRKQK